jgi:hypothetical protein
MGWVHVLDVSLERANQLYTWGWRLSVFGALITMLGVASLWLGTRIRDLDSESKLAALNLEAGQARERAGKLEDRAARVERESADIQARLAWRTLAPEAAEKLKSALGDHPSAVNIRYTDGDPEALFLAIQFSRVLADAHWQVAPGALKFQNALVFQIRIPGPETPQCKYLRDAFTAAGIPFLTEELPPMGAAFSISQIADAPILMIGSKPP